MHRTKRQIILLIVSTLLLAAAIVCAAVYSGQRKVPEPWTGSREFVFEAEDAELSDCEVVEVDKKYDAHGGETVGYLEDGATIVWEIDCAEEQENAMLIIRVSCPLSWIGSFNLPQAFIFDGLYTLHINDDEIETNAKPIGSVDVSDHNNYYYWTEVVVEIKLKEGRNVIMLNMTNRQNNLYASSGTVDCITVICETELEAVNRRG